MTTRRVVVEKAVLDQTIRELAKRRLFRTERVALWLGARAELTVRVREMYVPQYEAASDYFHIGRPAMAALMEHLRETKLMIGAQLHTHPAQAFHSAADDRWAIVRHVGALSIVLPDFGRQVTTANFLAQAKVFSLSASNEWGEIDERDIHQYLEIIP